MYFLSYQRPTLGHTFYAFNNRNYRILWPANFFSLTARWMQMTLLAWMVLELTDSAWLVAHVGTFSLTPMFFLGLISGVMADSVNRKVLLRTTQGTNLCVVLIMTWVLFTGNEQYWHAYIMSVVIGASWSLELVVRRTVIFDLIGSRRVTNALALDSIGMTTSSMLGPLLAGILISQIEVKGGYAVVCCLYVVSLTLIWFIDPPTRQGLTTTPVAVGKDLLQGLSYSLTHKVLLAVILVTITMNLMLFSYRHMVPVVARDILLVGPALMGLLQAGDGFGASLGAIIIASKANIRYHGRLFVLGSLLAMGSLLFFSLSPTYWFSLPLMILLGTGVSGFATMQATLTMLVSPANMRGKNLGVISLAIGTAPIGAIMVGALAERYDAAFALTITAAIGFVGIAVIGVVMPALRGRIS